MTANVSTSAGPPAVGTVSFLVDGAVVAPKVLDGNASALLSTTLSAGRHMISAEYGGATKYQSSVAPTLTQEIYKVRTQIAMTSSISPSLVGQSVSFSVSVSAALGSALSGNVTILDFGSPIGSVSVSNGVGACVTASLSEGPHSISAVYAATPIYESGESAPIAQIVVDANQANTTAVVAVSLNPAHFRQQIFLTANLSAASGVPQGSVQFFDGNLEIESVQLDPAGQAVSSLHQLGLGRHRLTAVYLGDAQYASAISAPGILYQSPRPR